MKQYLEFSLLGGSQIRLESKDVYASIRLKKAIALLVYLVSNPHPHARESLAAMLWDNVPQENQLTNLRVALAALRRDVEEFIIVDRTSNTIAFNTGSNYWVDAHQMDQQLEALRQQISVEARRDPGNLAHAEEAVSLYHGVFMQGFSVRYADGFDRWLGSERERKKRLVVEGLDYLVQGYFETKDYSQAIRFAQQALHYDNTNESIHRQLMLMLALTGQRSQALSQYIILSDVLTRTWDISPEEETTALFDQIRANEIAPEAAIEPLSPQMVINPYKGLNPFTVEDQADFFGRGTEIDRLVRAVYHRNFVPLVGASGSGKSSVVAAGLIPRLHALSAGSSRNGLHWVTATMRPSSSPVEALARALRSLLVSDIGDTKTIEETLNLTRGLQSGSFSLKEAVTEIMHTLEAQATTVPRNPLSPFRPHISYRLLLFIDQFEELFTLCPDPKTQQQFLELLFDALKPKDPLTPPVPMVVVIALRADFIRHALEHRPLAAFLEDPLWLSTMDPSEFRAAIEEPALARGVGLQPGLADRIISDVGEAPGRLPLLEFAMSLLWEKRATGYLTLDDYMSLGQVEGALTKYANRVYRQLTPQEQTAARQIFIQLVQPGEGAWDSRRVASRTDIGEENWKTVQRLVEARLVVTDQKEGDREERVEIVHEVLISEWELLKRWVEAAREFRSWQEDLRQNIRQWETSGREDSALLSGTRLIQANEWLATHGKALSTPETEFIALSQRVDEEEQLKKEAVQQRDLAVALRMRRLAWGFSIASFLVLVSLIAAGTFNQGFRKEAAANATLVVVNEHNASLAQTQQAIAEENEQIAQDNFALAEAGRLAAEADNLLNQDSRNNELIALLALQSANRQYTKLGDKILVAAAQLDYPSQILYNSDSVYNLLFLDDGVHMLTGNESNAIQVWNIQTGQKVRRVSYPDADAIYDIVLSPDGQYLLTAEINNKIHLWDYASGELLWEQEGRNSARFSPDGSLAAYGNENGEVQLRAIPSGEVVQTLTGAGSINAVVFSPDGSKLFAASEDKNGYLWDLASGELLFELIGHTDRVQCLDYSPDGKMLLTGSFDNTARVWDAATGELLTTYAEHTGGVESVAFSPDSQFALTGSRDGSAQLWDPRTGEVFRVYRGHSEEIATVAFSPDGKSFATGSADDSVRIWEIKEFPGLPVLTGHETGVNGLDISPDGRYLASNSGDLTTRIWDTATGKTIQILQGHTDFLNNGVAFSPDGTLLATGSWDASLRIWDVVTGQEVFTTTVPAGINGVAFSPDGKLVAEGDWGGIARVFDITTGEEIQSFTGHEFLIYGVTFSGDGKKLLTGAFGDNSARLWEVQTGEMIQIFEGHTDAVTGVAISPDGKYVLTGSGDATARLWDIETGKEVRQFIGHSAILWDVAFSADGSKIITASGDGTARLFDTATGEQIRQFAGHNGGVESVVFSLDEKYIITSGDDGTIRYWLTGYQDVVDYLCGKLIRDLTRIERIEHLILNSGQTCP